MKTQKEKVVSKTKKPAAPAATPKKTRNSTKKTVPTEDEIREKAREIYYERMARGEHGTPEDDWHEAESILRGL
ncbi:MAG TPA: hypothetical protein VJ963_02865 [Bacteroidales bacterium]|nr:hypothetical protein [Bacteroidales bacterium]